MRIYIVYCKGLYKYDLEYISTAEKMPGASAPGVEQKWDMKRDNILRIFSEFQRSTFGFFCFLFISIGLLLCALRPFSTELSNPTIRDFGSLVLCFCSSLNSIVKLMQIIFGVNFQWIFFRYFIHVFLIHSFSYFFYKLKFLYYQKPTFQISSVSHIHDFLCFYFYPSCECLLLSLLLLQCRNLFHLHWLFCLSNYSNEII